MATEGVSTLFWRTDNQLTEGWLPPTYVAWCMRHRRLPNHMSVPMMIPGPARDIPPLQDILIVVELKPEVWTS